jgi:hypothetical protein
MGLRDRWRAGREAAQEAVGGLPADIDELRPDLRDCVDRIHPADHQSFLGPYRSWGSDVEALPPTEPILAAAPVVSRGRGMLVLTSERLFYGGQDGKAEIPLRELSVSRVETDSIGTLRIFTDEGGDRYHEFGMSPYKKETRGQFIQALTGAIREVSKPVTTAQTGSAADELEKFAALRDKGVITEEEFEEKKRGLLS